MPPSLLRPVGFSECSSPSVTLLARVRRQVPAEESKLAEKALQALGIALISGRGEDGSDGAANIITVMGSWNLSEAQKLVTSGTGGVIVRGVSLLEYCAMNPGKRDLLTRAETPCILNVALRGETVCFSGINGPEKTALAFRVEAMGGHVSPVLNEMVTVVVARETTSEKCKLALKLAADRTQEVSVVYPTWLDDCIAEKKRVDPSQCANHGECRPGLSPGESITGGHYKYLIPVLKPGSDGDVVSTTGFSLKERNTIQSKVELLGGRFDKQLDDKCTVLIAKHASGDKYDFARKKSIPIVAHAWLDECILCGSRADPKNFNFLDFSGQSQNSQTNRADFSSQRLRLTEIIVEDSMDVPMQPFSNFCNSQHSQSTQQTSQTIDTNEGTRSPSENYLEDKKIFLAADIHAGERAQLLRLCRAARATTISADPTGLPKSRGITHIVSGKQNLNDELIKIQSSCDLCPPCVHSDWLRQCAVERRSVDTYQYMLKNAPEVVAPPQHKLGLHGTSRSVSVASSGIGGGDKGSKGRKTLSVDTSILSALEGESIPSASSVTTKVCLNKDTDAALIAAATSSADEGRQEIAKSPSHVAHGSNTSPGPHLATEPCKFFEGKTFSIVGLLEKDTLELTQLIKDAGGSVSAHAASQRGLSDFEVSFSKVKSLGQAQGDAQQASAQQASAPAMTFGVGRFVSRSNGSKRATVSEYWVRKCCAVKKLLPPDSHKMYKPLNRALVVEGCGDLAFCISGMHGASKRVVLWLAEQCNLCVEPDLTKKRTTHLIACMPLDGPSEKLEKAKKWKIKVASLAWLEECVVAGSMKNDVNMFPPGPNLDYLPPSATQVQAETSGRGAARSLGHSTQAIDTTIQLQADRNALWKRRQPLPLTFSKNEDDACDTRLLNSANAHIAAVGEGWLRSDDAKPRHMSASTSTPAANLEVRTVTGESSCAASWRGKLGTRSCSAEGCGGGGESTLSPILSQLKSQSLGEISNIPSVKLRERTRDASLPRPHADAYVAGTMAEHETGKEAKETSQSSQVSLSSPSMTCSGLSQRSQSGAKREEAELAQVLQDLSKDKSLGSSCKAPLVPSLSVKRRRCAQHEDNIVERGSSKHACLRSAKSLQIPGGGGGEVAAGKGGQDRDPKTIARAKKGGSRYVETAAAAVRTQRGRDIPNKLLLNTGRRVARHASDDDEEEEDGEEEDDTNVVHYVCNKGKEKLDELVGRLKARKTTGQDCVPPLRKSSHSFPHS